MRRGRIVMAGLVVVGSIGLAGCLPPAPRAVSCGSAGDGTPGASATVSAAIAECHKRVKGYTTSSGLMASAKNEAAERAGMPCNSNALQHSAPGGVSENLYCMNTGTGVCPTSQTGATQALNRWLSSAGHAANIDGHSAVGAGVICTNGHYFAVAHYQ